MLLLSLLYSSIAWDYVNDHEVWFSDMWILSCYIRRIFLKMFDLSASPFLTFPLILRKYRQSHSYQSMSLKYQIATFDSSFLFKLMRISGTILSLSLKNIFRVKLPNTSCDKTNTMSVDVQKLLQKLITGGIQMEGKSSLNQRQRLLNLNFVRVTNFICWRCWNISTCANIWGSVSGY